MSRFIFPIIISSILCAGVCYGGNAMVVMSHVLWLPIVIGFLTFLIAVSGNDKMVEQLETRPMVAYIISESIMLYAIFVLINNGYVSVPVAYAISAICEFSTVASAKNKEKSKDD